MGNNLSKFSFLAVLILVSIMAGRGFGYSESVSTLNRATVPAKEITPLIVLKPPVALLAGAAVPGAATPSGYSSSSTPEVDALVSKILPQLGLGEEASGSLAENAPAGADNLGSSNSGGGNAAATADLTDGQSGFSRVGFDPPPATSAHSAVVADLLSGEMFFSLRLNDRWPLASLSKLVTAAVILDNINLSQTFTVENATGTIKADDRYSGSDLLKAMLMLSSNEAADTFADAYGRDKFVALMNADAANWGLADTYLDEPTGLSSANQSTIYDLMKLARHVYDNYPKILTITRTASAYVIELNSKKRVSVKNINQFAGEAGFLGGKTGYTDEALGNLLSFFSYGRRPILTIVLGSEDRFGDTQKLLEWFEGNYK